ncbi:MAG: hypothetical protein SPF70_07205 [Lachnospiraceae bacterium]|nr:hypothetical protein [Lachnospiraceae bacterium]
MATPLLRDIVLNQTTLTGKRKPTVTVTEARTRYKINPETNTRTDEIDGYSVDIIAVHGKLQTVKLPVETKATIDKIVTALKNNQIVTADFGIPSTLRGKCYAMLRNGQLMSGISCTADTINIVKIEDEVEDFTDDEVEL